MAEALTAFPGEEPDDKRNFEEPLAEGEIEVAGLRGDARKDIALERRAEIMRLRLGGYSYEQIATVMEIDPKRVEIIIKEGLASAVNERAEQLRVIENARLDRLQAAVWQNALKGDIKSIDAILRISTRRAALNGLDAPKKIDLRAAVKMDVEVALRELQQVVLGEVVFDEPA